MASHRALPGLIALGICIALAACGGDSSEDAADDPAAATEATTPELIGPTGFSDIRGSKIVADGCSVDLTFVWHADDPSSFPAGAEAVIKVKGPGLTDQYVRSVKSGDIRLGLSTPVRRGDARWRARILSVAGEPVPIQLPNSLPFQNIECGPGSQTPEPGSSADGGGYIPNAPVPGARCVPGQPLPYGLECK